MNDSWRLTPIDPGIPFGGDQIRRFNRNLDLLTKLIADLDRRVVALEAQVAKLGPAEGVGNDDPNAA